MSLPNSGMAAWTPGLVYDVPRNKRKHEASTQNINNATEIGGYDKYDESTEFFLKSGDHPHQRESSVDEYEFSCRQDGEWKPWITIPREELESKKNLLLLLRCPECEKTLYLVRGFCLEMHIGDIMKLECKRRIRQDEGNGDSRALTILGDFISAFKDEKKEEKEGDGEGGKDAM